MHVQSFKERKQLVLLMGRYAGPIVLHGEHLVIALRVARDADPGLPLRGAVLDGVGKQVVEYTFKVLS